MRFALWLLPALACAQWEWREIGTGRLELRDKGQPVLVYNYGMQLANGAPEERRRAAYLHPVYAPDGTILTDDFPKDHYHHRGIFWAWPVVKVGGERFDQWLVRDTQTRFERFSARSADGRLEVENAWYAKDRRIVKETVAIAAHPAKSGERALDFRLVFEAVGEPIELSGQPDPKAYGGFSVRFAPRQETAITTDSGKEAKDSDLVPHPWARLDGVYQGRRAGLRIDVDPSNPGAPNGWCLRHYGFLGVNYPGHETHTLVKGRPLTLKYRVTLFAAPR